MWDDSILNYKFVCQSVVPGGTNLTYIDSGYQRLRLCAVVAVALTLVLPSCFSPGPHSFTHPAKATHIFSLVLPLSVSLIVSDDWYLTVCFRVLRAADAVLTGHTENIIAFHMKNISNSKDKAHLLLVKRVFMLSLLKAHIFLNLHCWISFVLIRLPWPKLIIHIFLNLLF